MDAGNWTQLTLHTVRLIGTAVVLVLCIAGRGAVDAYLLGRSSGAAKILMVSECTIPTPLRRRHTVEGQRNIQDVRNYEDTDLDYVGAHVFTDKDEEFQNRLGTKH